MKALFSILALLILAGCGPSPEQVTSTAVMAQAQTQTAAPTSTPTLTPTLTATPTLTSTPTLPPTITYTPRVRAENGSVIPHDAPGDPPSGMPEAGLSSFFESNPIFTLNVGGSVKIKYLLFLEKKGELPPGAVLEVHFQNPSDPSTALVVVVTDLAEDTIMVESKQIFMSDFECRNYWIDIHIYADSEAIHELGTHVQWTNSSFC